MRSFVALLLALAPLSASGVDPAANTFAQRLDAYVKIRQEASRGIPALGKKSTPAEISNRETALAAAIRSRRLQARPGDIFTPEVKAMFKSLLHAAFTGPGSTDRRASVQEGNPKVEQAPGDVLPVLQVNAVYPKGASLSTVPPSLLMKLPSLPHDLEYRFVGRTLLLRDSQSNLIVDFLPEAVPAR